MTTATSTDTAAGVFTQNWAILATEAAGVLFIFTLIIAVLAWLNRRKRINAARALLNERNGLAGKATETFHTHVQALSSRQTLTDNELDDYNQRSLNIINEFIQPWLEPSTEHLRQAVNQIMMIRHNDLHQIAALLRPHPTAITEADEVVETPQIQKLQAELAASQKAEAERSAQLAEALKSVSIIVEEYGRKFDVQADYQAPQILRALIYLQSLDQGLNQQEAANTADLSLKKSIDSIQEHNSSDADDENNTSSPTDLDPSDDPQAIAEQPSEQLIKETQADVNAESEREQARDLAPSKPAEHSELAKTAPDTAAEQPLSDQPSSNKPEEEFVNTSDGLIDLDSIELPVTSDDNNGFDLDLDDIDALLDAEISRQQEKTDKPSQPLPNLGDDDLDLSKKP